MSPSWIVKLQRRGFIDPNSSAPGFSRDRTAGGLLLRIIKGLFLLPAVVVTSLAVRWSVWSTTSLTKLWLRVRWKPALIDQGFYSLLLVKVKVEKTVTDFAQLLCVRTLVQISPVLLQSEEAPSGERHNNGSEVEEAMEARPYSSLSYYMVSQMPGTLAIVRYHARDDHDRTTAVGEERFEDTPEDFCRLQDEVEEALLSGIDVAVMSNYDPEIFTEIHKYLVTNEDESVDV